MAVKVLASSGGDYTASTVQSGWIATYLAGLSGSFTEDEILEVNNEAHVFTAGLDFSAINPGSFKIIVRPQTGEGAGSLWNSASDAARYGTGARLTFNNYGYDMLKFANNVELRGLSIYRAISSDSVSFSVSGKTGVLVSKCLIDIDSPGNITASGGQTWEDCYVAIDTNGSQRVMAYTGAEAMVFRNCTFLGDLQFQATAGSGTITAYNNAHIGPTRAVYDEFDGGDCVVGNCATDYSDMGDTGGGSDNLTSQTAADMIENPTYASPYDLRAKSTGPLAGAGSNAQKTSTDFYGTSRANPPYIGAHEIASGGGGGGVARIIGGRIIGGSLVRGGL
jgi:hypothetical protein